MLSVIGGLAVMLGSSPLAAQAGPSASRVLRFNDSGAGRNSDGDDFRCWLWLGRASYGAAAERVRHTWTAPSAAILLAVSAWFLSARNRTWARVPSYLTSREYRHSTYEVTASSTADFYTFEGGSLTAADQVGLSDRSSPM